MVIREDVLRNAAERYRERKTSSGEHQGAVMEMLERCSDKEVLYLLSQSNQSVTLYSFWIDDEKTTRLSISVAAKGLHNQCVSTAKGLHQIDIQDAINSLIKQKCDPIEIENTFWAKIQKIVDSAPG